VSKLKPKLFLTTALVCVTWLSTLFTSSSATALRRNDIPESSNKKFICYYGLNVYDHYWSSDSNWQNGWQSAATPIWGHGKTVSKIIVAESPKHKASFKFRVALYNDNDGKPGGVITGASTTPSATQCQLITVSIQPTRLTRGQRYWVVESADAYQQKGTVGGKWLFDVFDDHTSQAMYKYGFDCCCSTCDTGTSVGWSALTNATGGFYVKVK
jgi:hypothetical protein